MLEKSELRLTERQKLLTLLYLTRRIDVVTLMRELRTCAEMSLLRLPEGEP